MTIIEVKNQNKIKECISFLNENISEKDIVLYYQGKKPNFNFHKSVNKILDVLNDYFINDNKNILKWKDAIMNQKDDVYKEDNIAILPKYEKNCKEYEANYKEYFKFWQKTNEESSKSNYKEYFEFWQNSKYSL